jgi:hypothetical protein
VPEPGDPDWPAFSKEREGRQWTAVMYSDPAILGGEPSTSPSRSVTAMGWKYRWSSLLLELRLQVYTIVIWRR